MRLKTILIIAEAVFWLSAVTACNNAGLQPHEAAVAVGAITADAANTWIVLPVRSKKEYLLKQLGGEGEQHMHGIARSLANPDIIYLSQDVAQLWKSIDAGKTWNKLKCANMFVKYAQGIEVDPVNSDIVFAIVMHHTSMDVDNARKYAGLYRSTDGGDSWTLVLHALSDINRSYQHTVAYDAGSIGKKCATRWYAAFNGTAIYRSDNAGISWRKIQSIDKNEIVHSLQINPVNGNLYFASQGGVSVLESGIGKLRHLSDNGIPRGGVTSVALHPKNNDVIYAVLEGKGLYISENAGRRFELLKAFNAYHVFINQGFPEVIYLTGESESLVSKDAGTSWKQIRLAPPSGLGREWKRKMCGKLTGIAPDPRNPANAVAYSQADLWRTNTYGAIFIHSAEKFTGFSWHWWNSGAAFDTWNSDRFIFMNCDVGMVITENAGGYFERCAIPWSWVRKRINWTGMYAGDIMPVAGSRVIVASCGMYFTTKLLRSADGGKNWSIVDDEYNNNLFVKFHPHAPDIVYAGGKISENSGISFRTIEYLKKNNAEILGMCAACPDTIYAVTKPRTTILRSDDRGAAWKVYARAPWLLNRLDSKPTFAVHPKNPNIVYTIDAGGDLVKYDGASFTPLGVLKNTGMSDSGNFVSVIASDVRFPDILYAGTYMAGTPCVWRSTDGGCTWVDISANLPRAGCGPIAVHPLTGDVMMGTNFGTWIYPPPYGSPNSIYAKTRRTSH